jgi:DNA modification methylase
MIELLKGNCLDLMKGIESGSIDAIITDPPYGTTACKWDSVIDFTLMWEQLNRIIKPNGAIVLFGSEPFSSALRMSNIKNYKYDWVWEKTKAGNFAQCRKIPMKYHENILVFYKNFPTFNLINLKILDSPVLSSRKNKGANLGHVSNDDKIYYQTETGFHKSILKFSNKSGKGYSFHPTQKPVDLMEYLIKTYTNKKETVLDFTMGSGSTAVACKNTNRNFIGIEMDAGYFDIAKQRIQMNKYDLFKVS